MILAFCKICKDEHYYINENGKRFYDLFHESMKLTKKEKYKVYERR